MMGQIGPVRRVPGSAEAAGEVVGRDERGRGLAAVAGRGAVREPGGAGRGGGV